MSEEENTQDSSEEEVAAAKAAKEAEALRPIKAAFQSAFSEDAQEDEVKMAMITAGAKFKNVTRLYNQFMIEDGHAVSKADKDNAVAQLCEGQDLTDEVVFNGIIADLVANVQGTNDRGAASLIRAYAKKNEVECYKKPKGEGSGRSGFASQLYAFVGGSEARTKEDVTAFVNGDGDYADTSDNVKKHLSHYLSIHALVEAAVTARS